jgi:2-polyprenyl-3-methyl-5-hydroxy-6-metoxy-1,4-benzoquinol methylase
VKLGLYQALADDGPATAAELAKRTSTNERLIREWLEQQGATELLDAERQGDEWRFALPPEHAGPLLDQDALDGVAGGVRGLVAELALLPRLVETYRTGVGIPYDDYGPDEWEGREMSSKAQYLDAVPDWVAALPADLRDRLARVLDLGCGPGWSSIALGRSLPAARVDGVDLNVESIEIARRLAETEGVADRVRFEVRDAAELAGAGYDLVTMFLMLHDLARPVEVLRTARQAIGDSGAVLVADLAASEEYAGPADARDRTFYGYSLVHCLPATMAEPDSAAIGTVIRPSTVRALAADAGFGDVSILPVDHDVFRLYLLRP